MLKNIFTVLIVVGMVLFNSSCEDPDEAFNPKNPDLAVNSVVGVANSSINVLAGANRQLSRAMNELVVISEIASDNYENTQTFFNQALDGLNIRSTDDDLDDTQFEIHRLRELAKTGLEVIVPGDENSSDDQIAEFNLIIGFSHLLFGESFKAVPAEPGGMVMDAATHLNVAIASFESAISSAIDPNLTAASNLGIARAYYRLGDKAQAVQFANAALAIDPSFVRYAEYDAVAVNGPTNTMQNALYDRGSFDDLQPLPTLDFLDPKYNGSDATQEVNIPILKTEEAHLIIIEAAIADGNLANAQQGMKDLITLVSSRPTLTFDDAVEGRTEDEPGSRPSTANVMVSAGGGAPLRSGLVIDRAGVVTIPSVSGTSITEDMVDAISSADEALETLYLMRQEIFIAEGRRMVDLGIRFVVSDVELRSNSNVTDGDITPIIPDFIGNLSETMDAFTFDSATGEATVTNNLNKVLVQNKASELVVPFE